MLSREEFKRYLPLFEEVIVARGIAKGILGKDRLVPVRSGRLWGVKFGRSIGEKIESELSFAVDYYGYIKKSTGFFAEVAELQGVQVKMMGTKLVYFASIRIEDIARLSSSLVQDFPDFKEFILSLRGFKKNEI